MRGRTAAYALLALAAPLPAFALPGGEEVAQSPSLSVSASLDTCGVAAEMVVCKIDASWNEIPGAERHAASVTRADGSVIDYGDVGAGGSSFWVPYAGNGTYTVSVSVYGTPPGVEAERILAKDADGAGQGAGTVGTEDSTSTDAGGDSPHDAEPGAEPRPPSCEPEPEPEEPRSTEEEPEDEAGDRPTHAAEAGEADALDVLSAEVEATLDDEAALPEAVDCPDADAE
jgi:hypothetical protein